MFDSREKRAAALGFGLAFALVLPLPDGTIAIEDAAQVASWYRYDLPDVVPPASIGRDLALTARVDTTIALAARADVALSVAARADTAFALPSRPDTALNLHARVDTALALISRDGEAMPIQNDLTIYRGEDITLNFTVQDAAGAAVDCSAWPDDCLMFTLTTRQNAADKIQSIAGEWVNKATGTYRVILPSADVSDRTPAAYYYDVFRVDDDNKASLSIGKLTIKADSYRPAAS